MFILIPLAPLPFIKNTNTINTHCDTILLVSAVESSLFSSDCCKPVKLSATGEAAEKWQHFLGSYEVYGEEEEGAHVYKNSYGYVLYRRADGTWRAGSEIGTNGTIRSVGTAECPAHIRRWQYKKSSSWIMAGIGDINVQCKFLQ